MKYKVYYKETVIGQKEDVEGVWMYKTETSSMTEGLKELMEAFFNWANKNNKGCLPWMIINEDYQ